MRILEFNLRLYKKNAIRTAIADYRQIAECAVRYTKQYSYVSFQSTVGNENVYCNEFCNYVLGLSRKCL